MATIIRKEVRKRGLFGWLFLLVFIAFNLFMLVSVIGGASNVSQMQVHSEAEKTGQAIGAALGMGALLFFWACGSIVLGLLALVTRGQKTIVEETVA